MALKTGMIWANSPRVTRLPSRRVHQWCMSLEDFRRIFRNRTQSRWRVACVRCSHDQRYQICTVNNKDTLGKRPNGDLLLPGIFYYSIDRVRHYFTKVHTSDSTGNKQIESRGNCFLLQQFNCKWKVTGASLCPGQQLLMSPLASAKLIFTKTCLLFALTSLFALSEASSSN